MDPFRHRGERGEKCKVEQDERGSEKTKAVGGNIPRERGRNHFRAVGE